MAPKDDATQAAQKEPVIQLSQSQLQDFIKATIESQSQIIKTYIEESKKPDASEIERINRQKQEWAETIRQAAEMKQAREDACTHIQPDSGKYRIWRFFTAYPEGAYTLICSACQKKWVNYEYYTDERGRSSVRLTLANPEFERVWNLPTVSPKDPQDRYMFRTS